MVKAAWTRDNVRRRCYTRYSHDASAVRSERSDYEVGIDDLGTGQEVVDSYRERADDWEVPLAELNVVGMSCAQVRETDYDVVGIGLDTAMNRDARTREPAGMSAHALGGNAVNDGRDRAPLLCRQ